MGTSMAQVRIGGMTTMIDRQLSALCCFLCCDLASESYCSLDTYDGLYKLALCIFKVHVVDITSSALAATS